MLYIQQELWANEIVLQLETANVAMQLCNTNLAKMQGSDIWHIVAAGDVDVFDVDDTTDIEYSVTDDSETQVTKNFDKGFGLLIKQTDVMQTQYNWQQIYAQRGAYKLGNALDTAILGQYSNAGSDYYSTGTTAWQFTKSTCAEIPAFFAKLKKVLVDADLWGAGIPYVVGPSGFGEAIDTYCGYRLTAMGDQALMNGASTFMLNGFRVFISNNCTTASSVTHGIAGIMGQGIALGTYVDPQLIEYVGKAHGRYGELVRGRLAAGHKVYRSAAVIDVNFNSTVVATT